MGVIFDGQSLIPAPLVAISKQLVRDSRGLFTGNQYTFTLTGTIVNVDTAVDSPGASGASAMRGVLLGKQYIRNVFDVDVGLLEISDPSTTTDQIQTRARPISIDFQDGVWVNRCNYVVTLSSNQIVGSTDILSELESISEDWNAVENQDATYSVSHNIAAKGLLVVTSGGSFNTPLSAARQWVNSRSYAISNLGILSEVVSGSGVMNLSNLLNPLTASSGYWNRQSSETVNPIEYSWSLTENFIYSSGNFQEDYSISLNGDTDLNNRLTFTINGSVIGNAGNIRDYSTRFSNAQSAFNSYVSANIYTRTSSFVPNGYTLNPQPISKQISYERNPGAVTYNYTYIAVSGVPMVSGAIEESIDIADNGPADIFASIPVPGRSIGPVIQYMSTYTLPERSVSINATIPSNLPVNINNLRNRYLAKPNTNTIIDALKPEAGYYYITQDSEAWNPIKGNYSRTISWVIQPSGGGNIYGFAGIPSGIHNTASGM